MFYRMQCLNSKLLIGKNRHCVTKKKKPHYGVELKFKRVPIVLVYNNNNSLTKITVSSLLSDFKYLGLNEIKCSDIFQTRPYSFNTFFGIF